MFVAALVLLFILRLRFPKGQPISNILTRRYGRPALLSFRKAEKSYFKAKKVELDLKFLKTCKDYDIIPKFIRFRVHNPNFLYTRTYRSWQFKLLDIEIDSQSKKLKKCKNDYARATRDLESVCSYFDFKCIESLIKSNLDKKVTNVKRIHDRKLYI